jgi:hypothetical protein
MAYRTGFNERIPNATNPGIRVVRSRHRVETACDFLRIVRIANAIMLR